MANCTFEWRVQGDGDDEWRGIKAFDAYEAAKKAVEIWDAEDYEVIKTGQSPKFEVRLVSDDRTLTEKYYAPVQSESTFWTAWGEAVPTYYPSQVNP